MIVVPNHFREFVKNNYKVIQDKDVEYAFIRDAKEGNQKAIDALVNSQLLAIFVVIKQFHRQSDQFIQDIFNAGVTGIVRAIQEFDFEKNVRFQTCAINWIRAAISEYIRADHVLSIPANHVAEIVRQKRLVARGYYTEDGNITELGLKALKRGKLKDSENFTPINVSLVSIHGTIGNESDAGSVEDTIGVEDTTEAEVESNRRINGFLDMMDANERRIMELLCGLNGEYPHTEQEIGDMMGISKQRVSQIKIEISKKIRKKTIKVSK